VIDEMEGVDSLTLVLSNPNVVSGNGQSGTWTMVYDEGFEITLGRRTFFAFSNFSFDGASRRNVSHCDQTVVGWYSNDARTEFGCYYGVRTERASRSSAKTQNKLQHRNSTPNVKPNGTVFYDTVLNHTNQKAKVDGLNKRLAMLQLSWRARVMPQFHGRTLREINTYAGIRRVVPARDQHLKRQIDAVGQPRSFLQSRRQQFSVQVAPLPSTFDWSDRDGTDFLEPVMDQADCGSCYDASTMRMLTARHKIKLNDTSVLPWSINFPLFCSEYNQGCKGGFGLLTTKWSRDVGLIPATCMRYNTKGSCKLECDLDKELRGKKRYRADNHRYVNSWYGNFVRPQDVEKVVREEMLRNGPVVLSFEPGEDFMFYSDGVYKTAAKKGAVSFLKNHIDYDQEWERVDHAVVAIGWGDEDGQPYWRIQNSWGADWGEDGFFRMARGIDESGIESIPEAADVVEDEQNGRQVAALFAEHIARK
jgi:cathepsin C